VIPSNENLEGGSKHISDPGTTRTARFLAPH
jgi:hypothetical protein